MTQIGFARSDQREEIARFMESAFPRAKWSRTGWLSILSGRWGDPDDAYAVCVEQSDRIVGVLGLIAANRPTVQGPVKTSNMTSWYVAKELRGQGIGSQMLALATADPSITVTNFSSARGAIPVVERAGFSILDDTRRVWTHSGSQHRFAVQQNPTDEDGPLQVRDRRILADHAGLNLTCVSVQTPEGACVIVLSIKQKHDEYVTYEAMYIGDLDIFGTYAQTIADSILPMNHAVLSVDQRFISPGVTTGTAQPIAVPRFYKGDDVAPEAIDHLYSEIVLLNLKMY